MSIRNRPLERDEVIISGPSSKARRLHFQIRTLPYAVCPPDEFGYPKVIENLVEPLFETLKIAYQAAAREQKENMLVLMREGVVRGSFASALLGEFMHGVEPVFPRPSRYGKCLHCGAQFGYVYGAERIRYCSPACLDAGKANARARWSLYRGNRRSNRRRNLECAHCSKRLEAKHANKQYCSVRCRVAAHRGKRKALAGQDSNADAPSGQNE